MVDLILLTILSFIATILASYWVTKNPVAGIVITIADAVIFYILLNVINVLGVI